MADFRKWLLVLAVVVFAASASAQTCTIAPANPPALRDGGLTELVGDIQLQCTGTATLTENFQVFMNSPVTNDYAAGKGRSIPALLINGVKVMDGIAAPSNPTSSVLFANIPVPLAAGTTTNVVITNIRVAVPAASTTFIPTQVLEFVSTSSATPGSPALPITNPTQIVGYVQPAFALSVTNCAGDAAANTSFQQCISRPVPAGAVDFVVQFKELFPTAFKSVADEQNPLVTAGVTDKPTQGTRLIVKFTNVTTGVTINVSDMQIDTGGATALNVPDADANGAGGTATAATGSSLVAPVCGDNDITHFVAANTSGSTIYAVWEVQTENLAAIDTLRFAVQVAFEANTGAGIPGLTTTPGAVTGTLAPVSTDITQSKSAPIPRFNTTPQSGTTPFQIVACVTNLLFPYVTSTSGYDTGIALVNTSLDNSTGSSGTPPDQPFTTSTQHGPCTVYFFGNMTIAPQTTPDVAAGSLVKFTMLFPLAGWANTAGFEGYIIARCNFQFAHGLAFIVDTHLPGFGSEAYLALVIPDHVGNTARVPSPFDLPGAGTGEQLVF